MRPTRRAALPWLALLLSLVSVFAGVTIPAHGAPTDDPVIAADWAAAWLADQVTAQGYVGGPDMRTSGSITIYTGLALAAADVERAAFDRVVAYVEAHHRDFLPDGSGVARPGAAGQVALLAAAAGKDPRAFGGTDLVAVIQGGQTPAGVDAGMYGVLNTSAAVFLHSFAMLGLRAAGVTPSQQAVQWLLDQQCPDGSWPAYRSATHRTGGTCATANPGNPEADASAMAIQALAVEGAVPANAADGLRLLQQPDGGFSFSPGSSSNANSSGLAVQAIAALGQDPAGEAWRQSGGTAMSGLLAFQVGCTDETAEHRGGFRYLAASRRPDALSTSQASWGLARLPFPFSGPPASLDASTCGANVPEPPTSPGTSESPSPSPAPSPTAAPGPSGGRDVERLSGEDRYVSAVEVSRELFVGGPPVAYLATGEGFADALSAGPAAAAGAGPVLLTAPSALPAVVADELARLRPRRIVVLGGEGVVSERVVEQAESFGPVERISGPDRYATAAAVSRSAFVPGVRRLLVATGVDFPDALAGMGAAPDGPVLLVAPDQVPDVTAAELRRLAPQEVLVLGGTAAISERVVRELQDMVAGTVRRVSGSDRYQTAALLLREGIDSARVLYVASGDSFADALAAAAAAGMRRTGILLVTRDDAPAVVLDEVRRVNPDRVLVLGGTARVSDRVIEQLSAA